jgi:hypothetical protein
VLDTVHETQHVVTLTALENGSTYHYQIFLKDPSLNASNSAKLFFETQALGFDPPQIASVDIHEYDSTFYEFYTLQAVMTDTAGVERDEFHWDGALVGTDYADDPHYEAYISPHALGLTRSAFFDQAHTLEARAFSIGGVMASRVRSVTPPSAPWPVTVEIESPAPDEIVYIEGSTVPAGTYLDVATWTAEHEWGCTWSGFSEGTEVPPGLSAVNCRNVTSEVGRITLKFDGAVKETYTPPPGETAHTFHLNLSGLSTGQYTVEIVGAATGKYSVDKTITIEIAEGQPDLQVTREVFRVDNYLKIRLNVENVGTLTAQLDTIKDYLSGYQQVNESYADYTVSTGGSWHNGQYVYTNQVLIDLSGPGGSATRDVAPGETLSVEYVAIYILYEERRASSHEIGTLPVKVTHVRFGVPVTDRFSLPQNFFEDPEDGHAWYAVALNNATQAADYVIVTNPRLLYQHYNTDNVRALLADMAHLAYLKKGVLGFLNTHDKHVLDMLIDPDKAGHWVPRLHPDFGLRNQGYVLIVGETEIMPSWYVGEDHFATYPGIPDHVHQSDLWYADVSGKTSRPELALGRIIGDSAWQLRRPILESIRAYEGVPGTGFDRSHALLVSGRGDGVTSNFIPTVNKIANAIDDEFAVTKIHWYHVGGGHEPYLNSLIQNTADQDVIFYRDHGNKTVWGTGLYAYEVISLPFGSASPFAFAAACVAGNYEASDDYNIAQAFLEHGAAVYVGATEISERETNDQASKWFFRNWEPSESIAVALNDTKHAIWGSDGWFDHRKLWAFEYNLYGDPKFGRIPGAAQADVAAPQAPLTSPLAIHVPDFVVDTIDGWDHVEIPGGGTLLEPGLYKVPYWSLSLDYPQGHWVQDVTLIDRASLVVTTGLQIPTATVANDCVGCAPVVPPATPDVEWHPELEREFSWEVEKNGDGSSTLRIKIYPFYYSPDTSDVLFYQDFTFDVQTVTSTVEIVSLQTDALVYRQGDEVAIDLWADNAGTPQDVIVDASVNDKVSGLVVGGLPLHSLHDLAGIASLDLAWDSSGVTPGHYYVQVELRDTEGNVLDRAVQDLTLGVTSGEITAFSAAPTLFQVGDSVDVSLVFSNTGSVSITGTAVVQVQIADVLTVTQTFTHPIAGLAAGSATTVNVAWDTSGATADDYRILGYVKYDSTTSEPQEVAVSTKARIYLPLVVRSAQ